MKFASFTLLALVNAEERRVPPRTPPQRLNTLQRFTGNWIDTHVSTEINRPDRALRMIDGMNRMAGKMTEAYGKDCHFFDPTVPNGGPDPNSRRKKRAAVAKKELARIARAVEENNDIDIFDQIFKEQAENPERTISDSLVRLSDETDLAWKQIGTGFRKWTLRYISDCKGQREFQYHTKRLAKIHGHIEVAYKTVGESQEVDYTEPAD